MMDGFIAHRDGRRFDLGRPIDISIPITETDPVNAFHLPPATFIPFRAGSFVGSIEEGCPVRCDVLTIAPHGNGTHTECIGHIAGRGYSLMDCLQQQLVTARLITVHLSASNTVSLDSLKGAWAEGTEEALIIRTMPNDVSKRHRTWSGNNPPHVEPNAMRCIVERGVDHLLIDLPSVDPEEDNGELIAHHLFWTYPENPRTHATITELIYCPDYIVDGSFLVNLNAAAINGDAAPSRPFLYPELL
jgi:arylformamidase